MPRQRIDRGDVTDAALGVIDTTGADDLTLAKVADELGVQSSALYNHVEGLTGLRENVARKAAESLAVALRDAAVARSGRDAVGAVGAAYRRFAADHPGQFEAAVLAFGNATPEVIETTTAITALFVRIVEALGAVGPGALDDARALHSAVRGFVLLESTQSFGRDADLDQAFDHLLDLVVDGIQRGSSSADTD
jgi:AcrR family transcriptional regulator